MDGKIEKILVINGGPRKAGNTIHFVQKLENEIMQKHPYEFNYLHLIDYHLGFCKGCNNCFFKGEKACPLHDDRENIFNQLQNADMIIFALPVYSLSMPALLKNFFDRFAYIIHRPCFFGKHTYVVVSTGAAFHASTAKLVKSITGYWGLNYFGKLTMEMFKAEKPKNEEWVKKKILKKSEQLMKSMKKNRVKPPKLLKVILFEIQKRLLTQDETLYDFHYWKAQGWLEKKCRFFENRKIHPFKSLLAKMTAKIVLKISG